MSSFGMVSEVQSLEMTQDEELAAKKLREIGKQMDIMREDLVLAEQVKLQRIEIEKKFEELKEQAKELENVLFVKRKEMKELVGVLIPSKEDTLKTLCVEIEQKHKDLESLSDSFDELKGKKEKMQSSLVDLQNEFALKEGSCVSLEEKIKNQNSQYEGMNLQIVKKQTELCDNELSLASFKVKAEQEKQEIEKQRDEGFNQLKDLWNEIEGCKKVIVASKIEAENIKAEANKWIESEKVKLTTKEKTLNDKEGEISLRESFLKEKIQQLISSKNEMEKFFNRPAPHINF